MQTDPFTQHHSTTRAVCLWLTVLVFLVGAGLLVYAQTLRPFKEGFLEQAYGFMENSPGYAVVREAYLTPRFALEDVGLTLMVLSFVIGWVSVRQVKSPSSAVRMGLFTLLPPVLSLCATAYGYHLSGVRFEYPPGDPIAAMIRRFQIDPVSMAVLFGWPVVHALVCLWKGYAPAPIRHSVRIRRHRWLVLNSLVCALLFGMAVGQGHYWEVVSLTAWMYFYLSLAAGQGATADKPHA